MQKPAPWTRETVPLLPGDRGTIQTLDVMRRFVNEALTEPVVRNRAVQLTLGCGQNLECQWAALRQWMAAHWRFVRDPSGVELVHRPERLLDQIGTGGYAIGDCDDAAVLGAALGKAVGFSAQFVVLGFLGSRGPFSHVYAELLTGTGWRELDITRTPRRPRTTRRKEVRV